MHRPSSLQASAVGLVSRGFRHVTVYEAAPEIGEVGAGIQVGPKSQIPLPVDPRLTPLARQVAPNFCRVLSHFGVLERLKPQAVRLGGASVRRYINNEQLNSTSFANLETDYGHPAFVVHRGDLHKALLDRALELGAQLKTGVRPYAVPLASSPCDSTTRVHRHTSRTSTLRTAWSR